VLSTRLRSQSRLILLTVTTTVVATALSSRLGVIGQAEPNRNGGEANPGPTLTPKSYSTAISDPIERTILEEVFALGPNQSLSFNESEPKHYPLVFSYLRQHPHLVYVVERTFPVCIDRTKNAPFVWEEIPSRRGQSIEHGFEVYCPKGFSGRAARMVRGEWSIKLDKLSFKSVVKSRISAEREEARRTNYMVSIIPATLRRITNSDPLLESYCFSIMVPLNWKIPKDTILDSDNSK
jgi:hypothetical protein